MTYCIGDSHISSFSGKNELVALNEWIENDNFRIYRAGPALAYNVVNKPDLIRLCNSVPKEERLLLCFGEIDTRAQVGRYITPSVSAESLVETVFQRYVQFLVQLENKNLILFGVTPCLYERPFLEYYLRDPKRTEEFDSATGTLLERNTYKRQFNTLLKNWADANGFEYESLFDEVLGKPEYYLDDLHLSGEKVAGLIRTKFPNS